MQETLAAHGLEVSSIGSPIGKIFIDEDFAPHLERMRHAADVAQLFGAPYIRLFSFFMRPGDDPDDHRDEVIDRMRALAEVAEAAGSDPAAREREGDLRRRPAPLPGHRRGRSARRTCGWPGIRPTSSRSGSSPSPRGTPPCARTSTTSRSRTRSRADGTVVVAGDGRRRGGPRPSARCATTASTGSSPSNRTCGTRHRARRVLRPGPVPQRVAGLHRHAHERRDRVRMSSAQQTDVAACARRRRGHRQAPRPGDHPARRPARAGRGRRHAARPGRAARRRTRRPAVRGR